MSRTQLPIVAGFALTVNKAQGLTIKEGVVIYLVSTPRFKPASKHGLPFVAWTRSESFAMTAFKNLPPWDDFVKGRTSTMLSERQQFIKGLQEMHDKTMRCFTNMSNPAEQRNAMDVWTDQQALQSKRRKQNGPVMPCQACVEAWGL